MRRSSLGAASALLVACAGSTDTPAGPLAIPIAVVNAGFESPAIAIGSFLTTAPPVGWTAVGTLDLGARTVGVLRPATTTLYAVPVPEGNNVGVVFLLDDAGNQSQFASAPAGLEQTLAATLQPRTTYTLSAEVGNIANDAGAPFAFGGFPGYRIELLAGGVVVGFDDSLTPTEGRFATAAVSLVVGDQHPQAGLPLGIRLLNLNQGAGLEVNFDHVRLSSVAR